MSWDLIILMLIHHLIVIYHFNSLQLGILLVSCLKIRCISNPWLNLILLGVTNRKSPLIVKLIVWMFYRRRQRCYLNVGYMLVASSKFMLFFWAILNLKSKSRAHLRFINIWISFTVNCWCRKSAINDKVCLLGDIPRDTHM